MLTKLRRRVARWVLDDVGGNMNEAEDGEWVRYSDAEAEIARLTETLHMYKLLNESIAETALNFRRQVEALTERLEQGQESE